MKINRIFFLALMGIVFSFRSAGETLPSMSVTAAFPGCDIAAWRAGDRLQVYHDGTVYAYFTAQGGDEVLFQPSAEGQATDRFDPSKPLYVYFNVDAVTGRGEAVFSVQAEQKPGELSGRLPQWGSVQAPGPGAKGPLSVKMSPLATVIALEASASRQFRVDRLVLLPHATASGFTSVSGARINPVSGKITLPRQTARPSSVGLATAGADLASHPVFHVMVAGVHPGNSGLIADFFRGRSNNMRAVILAGKDAGKDSGPSCLKMVLEEKKVGISTPQDFADFASSVAKGDRHGLKYCNEDAVVCLNADIDLSSIAGEGRNWTGINNLCADIDGGGHCLYGYRISRPANTAIILSTSASVRNVVFGRKGDYLESTGGSWTLVAPIAMTTNPNAVVEGCVNRGEVRSTPSCTGALFLGGIVGRSVSSIRNCSNSGRVNLDSPSSKSVKYAGGIAGNVVGDMGTAHNDISSCVNAGEVVCACSDKAWVGGVVGRISENARAWTVSKCTNKGKVSLSDTEERISLLSFVGGIAGEMASPSTCHGAYHLIKACRNEASVISNADGRISMGGIVGSAKNTVLDHCVNAASLSHNRALESDASLERNFVNMGGIVGMLALGSTVCNCENAASAAVTSDYSVSHRMGGIAGVSNKSFIRKCSNAAPVRFSMMRRAMAACAVGGICGVQEGSASDLISECTNSGDVFLSVSATGLNVVAGGIVAMLAKGGVERCKNSGSVTARNELALPDMNSIAGGIAGRVYRNDVSGVEGCSNTGKIIADAPYSPSKGIIASGEISGHHD